MDSKPLPVTWLTDTWGYTTRPAQCEATPGLPGWYGSVYQPVILVGAGLVITEELYFTTERAIREYVQKQIILAWLGRGDYRG